MMRKWLFIILLIVPFIVEAQQSRIFNIAIKGGASFGGSEPGRYREDKSANLMIDASGGIGLSVFFYGSWQLCVDFNYIRKGVNCPLTYTAQAASLYNTELSDPEVYGWFDNAYLEIPLTIGYTWGYDICRTRFGVYYGRRLATSSRLIIDGALIEPDTRHSPLYDLYEQHLANHDYGLKIANEFFFNNFSIGVEYSAGFTPSIRSAWRQSDSQSYTMAICLYLGYQF